MSRFVMLWLLAALVFSGSVSAEQNIPTERVEFEPGKNSWVTEDTLTGYEIIDYVLEAQEGQFVNISMATRHTSTYFNILAPGEDAVAIFNGSVNENQYEGNLPYSGEYKIRVYMMRSAARRHQIADFRLEIISD